MLADAPTAMKFTVVPPLTYPVPPTVTVVLRYRTLCRGERCDGGDAVLAPVELLMFIPHEFCGPLDSSRRKDHDRLESGTCPRIGRVGVWTTLVRQAEIVTTRVENTGRVPCRTAQTAT